MVAIQFENLAKNYAGRKSPVFQGLTHSLTAGTKTLLLGKNGSGKTTLLKILCSLSFPDHGTVLWNRGSFGREIRKSTGVFLANDLLYPGLTGEENLFYSAHLHALEAPERRVAEAKDFWGVGDFSHLPAAMCSNGMKTRLALARATLHNPKLLLLDEPAAFLDAAGKERLIEYLFNSRATVVVSSQSADPFQEGITQVIHL